MAPALLDEAPILSAFARQAIGTPQLVGKRPQPAPAQRAREGIDLVAPFNSRSALAPGGKGKTWILENPQRRAQSQVLREIVVGLAGKPTFDPSVVKRARDAGAYTRRARRNLARRRVAPSRAAPSRPIAEGRGDAGKRALPSGRQLD